MCCAWVKCMIWVVEESMGVSKEEGGRDRMLLYGVCGLKSRG